MPGCSNPSRADHPVSPWNPLTPLLVAVLFAAKARKDHSLTVHTSASIIPTGKQERNGLLPRYFKSI